MHIRICEFNSCVLYIYYFVLGYPYIMMNGLEGLYPGLAIGNGFDLYEPKTGPHVTLYGWVTLFYSLTSVCSTQNQAIWLAFALNLIGFSLPTAFLLNQSLKNYIHEIKIRAGL